MRSFAGVAAILRRRIELVVALRVERLDDVALVLHLQDSGRECLLEA